MGSLFLILEKNGQFFTLFFLFGLEKIFFSKKPRKWTKTGIKEIGIKELKTGINDLHILTTKLA